MRPHSAGSAARSTLRKSLGALPVGRKAMLVAGLGRSLPTVLRSGLFDREFYEAQRGVHYASVQAAAFDYVVHGRRKGFAPNPLVEPEFFVDAWNKGHEPVDLWLKRKKQPPPSPLFDPAAHLAAHPDAAHHAGGPLGHFLSTADASTPMPVSAAFRGPVPTWGTARTALLALAAAAPRRMELRGSRRRATWDLAADDAFVQTWTTRPVPDDDPLVTVVMPVRNRPVQVLEAIASVQAQTLVTWELVVVDDGSTDETPDVVAQAAARDGRIVLVRGAHGGVCAARNRGLAAARGRYVAFLDSDNTWRPSFLRVMAAYLHAQGLRAGHCVVDSLEPGPNRYLAAKDAGLEHLRVKNHVDLNSLMAQRSLLEEIGGFDEALRRWVDHDLAIRIAEVTALPLVPFVGIDYDGRQESADRITVTEHDHWEYVVLAKALVDWEALAAGLPDRVPGRVSIAMPTFEDWQLTIRAVAAVLDTAGDADVEVVVVDNGSRRAVTALVTAAFLGNPRVKIVGRPVNVHFATGSNLGFAHSTGETVVFLNNDTEAQPGWLEALLAPLADPGVVGVQPLLLYPDGSVQSAGTVFLPNTDLPVAFLADLPPDDARRLPRPVRLRVVTAAALAMRAADVVALRGFDPSFVNGLEDVDLCLRAVRDTGRLFEVAVDSVVLHHESRTVGRGRRIQANRKLFVERWRGRHTGDDAALYEGIGLRVAHVAQIVPPKEPTEFRTTRPILVRDPHDVPDGPAAGLPSLRWAIKIAAHAGPRGDGWGDVHFAAALARGLQALGQQVVVDRRDSVHRSTSYLDDVVLVLRGLDELAYEDGAVNLLWVISHPDLLGAEELRRYDAVFAASTTWAHRTTLATGVRVQPLLQAVDPLAFHPGRRVPEHRHGALFVGSSRNVFRPIVKDALEAGVDLHLYGGGWEQFGVGPALKAGYLPNDELGAAYAGADVVLCDHWGDMAREGFVSNRIFEAVASGARVVSDEVEGLDELFDGAVRTYSGPAELATLCSEAGLASFPGVHERLDLAERTIEQHSFQARAHELLTAAVALREGHWEPSRLGAALPEPAGTP